MVSISKIKSHGLRWLLAIGFLMALAVGYLAWQHLFPVTAGNGWTVGLYLDDVAMVSALAKDDAGALYVTREQKNLGGSLFKLLPDGSVQEVMSGLDKPDGLLKFRGGILVSQEGGDYPLLWLHDGRVDKLFKGKDIEGIDSDADFIYAIEDLKVDGHLLKFEPSTGESTVLRAGLVEAEGIAVCPDGRLFYSEKKKGWIKEYRQGEKEDPVVHAGLNAPGFLMCNQGGLWIAEDATHGARLLLAAGATGMPQVVLSHLRSAQTVLALEPGHLLVAEQGRNRILEINRVSDASR